MTNAQRISVSLLVSIVLVTGFAYLAYSGLFEYIETKFFNQRVTEFYLQRLEDKEREVVKFHQRNLEHFSSVLAEVDVQKVFSPNWDKEYIFTHNNLFDSLSAELPGLLYVRFIDQMNRIHYSTRDEDIERQGQYRLIYKILNEEDGGPSLTDLHIENDTEWDILIEEESEQLIYKFPLFDGMEQKRGTALFYLSKESLEEHLVASGVLRLEQGLNLFSNGYLFLSRQMTTDISEQEKNAWWN
ncbi:MAG TPA: hypothetical protein ENN41_02590, partial [Sediminispirochaeta sp.]|nr:hypothetical protein [Sediminispirochaeta sp.]